MKMMNNRCLALAALLLIPAVSGAQDKSVNPGVNRSFQNPDVRNFVERFEREGREIYDLRAEIVRACQLRPGMAVADIGAGTGLFTRRFAREVGSTGKVYAVDIAEEFVSRAVEVSRQDGWDNVEGVVCRADDTLLAPDSIDLAFICDTYHHFEYPQRTMASIRRALRPGGRLVVIDFERIPGESSDWTLGHVRAGQEVFRREIIAAGFACIDSLPLLSQNYFLVFEEVDRSDVEVVGSSRQGDIEHIQLRSPLQRDEVAVQVLVPRKRPQDGYRVVYVLPVEPGPPTRWGDPLAEIQRLDLHNRHGLLCVMPTFADWPWYADHPQDRLRRQESHLVDGVLPLVEERYEVRDDRSGRLLLGFSKSGWGAMSLVMRHPHLFSKAAIFDAPLAMTRPGKYESGPLFATLTNFRRYQVSELVRERAVRLQGDSPRLALLGAGNFQIEHEIVHQLLDDQQVKHVFQDGPRRPHRWDGGWLKDAIEFLAD